MAEARITFHPERRTSGTLAFTETHWGYIVQERQGGMARCFLAEGAMRFFGVVLIATALGQWMLPAALFPGEGMTARWVLSAVLLVLGGLAYVLAGRGACREVQVDRLEQEIRIARRRRADASRVLKRIGFRDIEAVWVEDADGGSAEILARVAGEDVLVMLVRGERRDLDQLRARLGRDLQSPRERVEARLRLAGPRKVAVAAPLRRTA